MRLPASQGKIILMVVLLGWNGVLTKNEAVEKSKRSESALLNLLLGDEMQVHIEDVVRNYEIKNAECQASLGRHWFFNRGVGECQFCGKHCPYGTQGDAECSLDCGRYWRELELNQTLLELKAEEEVLHSTTNVSIALSATALAIAVIGSAIGFLAICWILNFVRNWKRNADEMYERKNQPPQSDSVPRSDRRRDSVRTSSPTQATEV